MKFAKELEQDLVPEWRIKYLDYKAGKKQVKNVARAVSRAQGTPRLRRGASRDTYNNTASPFTDRNRRSGFSPQFDGTNDNQNEPFRDSPAPLGADSRPESDSSNEAHVTTPMLVPTRARSSKTSPAMQYGSFVPSPQSTMKPSRLELPEAALNTPQEHHVSRAKTPERSWTVSTSAPHDANASKHSAGAYEVGETTPPPRHATFRQMASERLRRIGPFSSPNESDPRPFLQRVLSHSATISKRDINKPDMSLEALDRVRTQERHFFKWMDSELEKVEEFYKLKEDEAGERLKVLREQLHEMRNRRIDEIAEMERAQNAWKQDEQTILKTFGFKSAGHSQEANGNGKPDHGWKAPVERAFENAKSHTIGIRPGPNSEALQQMGKSGVQNVQNTESGRDYVRKPHYEHEVPYRTAKRKLKLALKEFYRALELLKSYALLNRTAFRKINKKYDKAVDAHPPLRYMNAKVNNAWFVQSDVLDSHIHAVEDLYARYFERGNYKIAMGKLRSSIGKPGEHDGSAFRSGILIGTGAVFGVQGLIYAADLIHHEDPVLATQASYLLQIYGGYFLALYLFSWFCIDCFIWTRNRINYVFIFELDPRTHLDWRQLAEFPAFLAMVLGLFVWLNFSQYGAPEMFLYYPVVLIFVTALVIFIPAPIIFHRSRRWFVYSHWRLLLAGLYPVEFRDFFLGDMYCSLTYFTSNIELFFCLYAQHWSDPPQCNSTHSRLLGFFSALPGVWRAFQCLRRYYDTRAAFPHLANCGKYLATVMYYATLSNYRIQGDNTFLAVFITFATLNSIYTSIWDLFMDWSLCQPQAKKRFLRDVLGYKNAWYYYAAMILDVIVRFNWIFYAIFTHDVQHSTIASFIVAFTEVNRRAMWTLFRVENEHCANVTHFKASRDVPLPYHLHESPSGALNQEQQHVEPGPEPPATVTQTKTASPVLSRHRSRTSAAEQESGGPSGTVRHRGPGRTLTRIFAEAHTQDFEKKRKPGAGDSENVNNIRRDGGGSDVEGKDNSSDEDYDESGQDELDELDVRNASDIVARHRRKSGTDRRMS